MKLSPSKIDSFLKAIPANAAIILLYGKDAGLMQQRSLQIQSAYLNNQTNRTNVINIYNNQFVENPQISSYSCSNSLFGNDKEVLVFKQAKDSYTKPLQEYLKNPSKDTLIIAIAEDLSLNSSLRKFAEADSKTYAIPCYIDNTDTLRKFIYSQLYANNYTIQTDAMSYMIANLGLDRSITYNEIQKLLLYKCDDKKITIEDVENVIIDNNAIFIDKIHFSLFNLMIEDAYKNLVRILEEVSAVFVIRALANHTYRLSYILANLPSSNVDDLIKKINPPILFLYLDKFKEQLNIWNYDKAQNFAKFLIKKEIEVKTYPNVSIVSIKQMFITFQQLFDENFIC